MEVKLKSKHFFVLCCYLPPGATTEQATSFISDFQNMLELINRNIYDSLIIFGDFDDRCIDWIQPVN